MAGKMFFAVFFVVAVFVAGGTSLELKNGAYEELVIKIAENVPHDNCSRILENLETTLTSASQYLFSALDSRAFLRSATVLLPPSWPESCAPSAVLSASGETSDVTVLKKDIGRGKIFTQQSLGCGQPGDQIFLTYDALDVKDNTLARSLIKHFAMYRYGVFEEQGYFNDPVYPMCYYDDQTKQAKVTGCADLPINDINGICSNANALYNVSQMVDSNSRSSITFAAEAPSVSMFCDDGNHDRHAPTKHNLICQRRSVYDVIINHADFAASRAEGGATAGNQITDTTPKISYKKPQTTRYVFVIENSKDMLRRESWSYLRLALRRWARYLLPENSEIGLVLAGSTAPTRAFNLSDVKHDKNDHLHPNNRDKFYSNLPYTPDENSQPGCLHCALQEAAHMLTERTKSHGAASHVVIAIAPGMDVDEHLETAVEELKKNRVKVAAVNYPDVLRSSTLMMLAEETNGVDYAVLEQKLNVDTTLLSTYFELQNVLYNIVRRFYAGSEFQLPMEIHRREITDDGRSSVTAGFVLDNNMGPPAQFNFYTHNTVTPLIKSLKLTSPSQQVFTGRNDLYIDFKMIGLDANISESGSWTYTVEPYPGNPQPHFIQVMATPQGPDAPIVRVDFKVRDTPNGGPLVLLAEAKYGDAPILGAKVEVTVTKPETNGTVVHKNKFDLLDTGAGDPDITKGDGVYTRYFSAAEWGPGLYTFEVVVSDNGNNAYRWIGSSESDEHKPCCGSTIPSSISGSHKQLEPFQRVLPKVTIKITPEEIHSANQAPVGRIGNLKVQIIPEDMKARLSWTSPDMGGHNVARYEIRYATNILDVMDNFETSAKVWENGLPFPLAAGSETTFSLDMSQNKDLLDKPLYFAVKAFAKQGSTSPAPVSNWVRVLVPSPPPPPTIAPTYSPNEQSFWPNNVNNVGMDPIGPSIARPMHIGLELILPVVIGIVLLLALLLVYCYFCVVKKRARNDHKTSKNSSMKKDNLNSTITIVPSSPQHVATSTYTGDIPDPHQVGVPVSNYGYEEETKKRYSLVNQQEQQLIEELKQQQNYAGLSVISNSLNRNGQPLSPYNSWSASQLLHEHERRHSPMENMSHEDAMLQHQEMMLGNAQMDHVSVNGHPIGEHYVQGHVPPPVPPLPAYANGYPVNYSIYGVHQAAPPTQIYQSMPRNENFNASLQGSLCSVNSGEKKRRNVTMV